MNYVNYKVQKKTYGAYSSSIDELADSKPSSIKQDR